MMRPEDVCLSFKRPGAVQLLGGAEVSYWDAEAAKNILSRQSGSYLCNSKYLEKTELKSTLAEKQAEKRKSSEFNM